MFFSMASCSKAIDVGLPKTQVTSQNTFNDLSSARAALLGIYSSLEGYLNANTTTLPGLSADELISYSTPISRYYTNSLSASVNDDFWSNFYNYIYQANNLISQVSTSTGISDPDKPALIGEATFLRAFLHFYLVNYFGDIPYLASPDYRANTSAIRMSAKDVVYPMIIKDLLTAQADLSDDYPSANRTRVNKSVATAMLARVYLYTGDWANAEKAATEVISNSQYNMENNPDSVFLMGSQETILQLSPNVNSNPNAAEGYLYILERIPSGSPAQVSVSDFLYNAFEPGDLRKTAWIGTYTADGITYYHYAWKYKNDGTTGTTSEYSVVMRLAEQYLIRAEARAQQNNVPDAVDDLNVIRRRAALNPIPNTIAQTDCLNSVMQERRIELMVEWGHRWLDLKRTGMADTIMPEVCAAKGGVWKSDWQLYPIPIAQLNADPNMTTSQNPGY